MIVLDTNVVSVRMAVELDPAVARWLEEQDRAAIRITAVTRAEIRYGIGRLPKGRRRDRFESAADALFGSPAGRSLPFDDRAANMYGAIVSGRERIGRPIGVLDAQIAAIARANSATVGTRSVRGFTDTGVAVVNPFDAWRWLRSVPRGVARACGHVADGAVTRCSAAPWPARSW